MDDIGQIAQRLGMKPSEIVDVKQATVGVLAQTHDGNWTLIRDDGGLEFNPADPVAAEQAMLDGYHGTDGAETVAAPEKAAAPAKRAAPNRRSNR